MKNSGKYVLCFVLGSLIGAFVGVGTFAHLSKKPAQQQTKQIVDTSTIDTPTIDESAVEVETETATEIPPKIEPVTVSEILYEDDNCTIIFNNFESLKTVQRLYLTIENKNDNCLRGRLESFSINGIPIKESYSPAIENKGSISNFMTIINSKLQDENITRVNSIEFKMHIEFADNMSSKSINSYDTDTMTITR